VPGCLTAGHDGFDLRSDDRPDFGPALDAILSQRERMLVGSEAGAIVIVVELDEVFAPPEKHRLPGGQHGVDGDDQRLRPLLDGADGGLAPVERASEIGHLAGAEDTVLREGCGSSADLFFVLLLGFHSHERLLLHAVIGLGWSVRSILCTSAIKAKLDVLCYVGWDKGVEGCLRKGFER
jgi:hypothetical protein